jgi:hypothetical protein
MLESPPPFDAWIDLIFNHPVTEEAWYWDDSKDPTIPSEPFIDYATKLFRNSGALLARFSDGQVRYGLEFLISNSASNQIFALTDQIVPLVKRIEFLDAIFDLNRDCFEPRCTSHLPHLDYSETPTHVSPLNTICYMWWDIFIIWPNPKDPAMTPLADASLRVMEKCLSLSNIAVLEGALHGLGHFKFGYEKEVQDIINHFLKTHPELPIALRDYANDAATGCIL